jgi:hypothetical protein
MKKDSLVIDGKTFISSRRASEIAVYSKDYVGQLCREGKLVCRRVNRLWWVDEDSIRKHAAETSKSNHTSFRSADAVIAKEPAAGIPTGMAKKNIPHLAEGGIVTEPTLAIIGEAGPEAVVPLSGPGFRAAVESMVPDKGNPSSVFARTSCPQASTPLLASRNKDSHGRPVMYALFPRRIFAVGFVFALILIIGTVFASVSIRNSSWSMSAISPFRQMAAAYAASEPSESFIGFLWSSLESILPGSSSKQPSGNIAVGSSSESGSSIAKNGAPIESVADLSKPHAGLVVVPSQGSSTDAKLAQVITNSFSDNVTVTQGSDGTTGVIKPEFRTVAGHDFLYVLVPVKTASTSARSTITQ